MASTTEAGDATNEKNDPRPLISDLLKKHAKAIAECQEAIKNEPLYQANLPRYDEIFVLRYVMTHKNKVKPATQAIVETMKHREKHKLNEMGDIRYRMYDHQKTGEENVHAFPGHVLFRSFCKRNDGICDTHPDPDRGVVGFCLTAHVDMVGLAKEISTEKLAECYLFANEQFFQIMDEVTRRTGRLTKSLRVLDLADASLLAMDRTYIKVDAAAAKTVEDFYPQLLGKIIVINLPPFLNALWAICRPLFPKRVVEKVDFLNITKPSHVKRFETYISMENLPQRYGGKNPVWPLPYGGQRFAKPTQQS